MSRVSEGLECVGFFFPESGVVDFFQCSPMSNAPSIKVSAFSCNICGAGERSNYKQASFHIWHWA